MDSQKRSGPAVSDRTAVQDECGCRMQQTRAAVNTGRYGWVHATLGLLQIGPLLQPVTAPLAGVVAELRVDSGRAVGWGEPLVDLHPFE